MSRCQPESQFADAVMFFFKKKKIKVRLHLNPARTDIVSDTVSSSSHFLLDMKILQHSYLAGLHYSLLNEKYMRCVFLPDSIQINPSSLPPSLPPASLSVLDAGSVLKVVSITQENWSTEEVVLEELQVFQVFVLNTATLTNSPHPQHKRTQFQYFRRFSGREKYSSCLCYTELL